MSSSFFPIPSHLPYYISNKPVYSQQKIDIYNKHDPTQLLSSVSFADKDAVNQALSEASQSFDKMKKFPHYERKNVLLALANAMKEKKEEFGKIIALEGGKTLKDSLGEVDRAISTVELAAEESTRQYGEFQSLDIGPRAAGLQGIVRNFPIGVVLMISPFNFPLNLVVHKVAPAIAAGCSWILKPSEKTPLSSIFFGQLLSSLPVSLPVGSWSILPTDIPHTSLLVEDDRVNMITFTGSTTVGWNIKAKAPKKKVVLELGGNASCICTEDTNVDEAAQRIVFGAFYQNGQSCISVQNVYAHKSIYSALKEKLISLTAQQKSGDPFSDQTTTTAMIDEKEAVRVERWIGEAVKEGGTLLVGGQRKGPILSPAIVENCPQHVDLYQKEVFGPVFTLQEYTDFATVIQEINRSRYGLQTGIFTKDLKKAFYAYEELQVGGVVIGDVPALRVDSQPYGGVKDSGCGREGVRYAIQDMSEIKVLVLKNPNILS